MDWFQFGVAIIHHYYSILNYALKILKFTDNIIVPVFLSIVYRLVAEAAATFF